MHAALVKPDNSLLVHQSYPPKSFTIPTLNHVFPVFSRALIIFVGPVRKQEEGSKEWRGDKTAKNAYLQTPVCEGGDTQDYDVLSADGTSACGIC